MITSITDKNFLGHNSASYPLAEVLAYLQGKSIDHGPWSSEITCHSCDSSGVHYYRDEEIYYNEGVGFHGPPICEQDEIIDFAVYHCPNCESWWTYIE